MGGLNGRNDPLGPCQILKGVHGLVIGNRHILRTANIVQPCMLGTNTGVIQPGRDRVDRRDLAVLILAEIGFHSVEDAHTAGVDGRSGFKGVNAAACCLAADQTDLLVANEMVKAADGVRAAADTGDDGIGQAALLFQHLLPDLL